MHFSPNQKMMFDNISEMYYHLFMEMGLGINSADRLYDQDTMVELQFKEKYIKASTTGQPLYAGRNDIVFEPARNYQLMVALVGYYIDKEIKTSGDTIGYIAQYVEDDANRERQRVVIKTVAKGDIVSQFYLNVYLAYIECIFALADMTVDLSNLDIVMEFNDYN